MSYNYGNEIPYEIVKLTPKHYDSLEHFDCEHDVINNYFKKECKKDYSVVTCLFINPTNNEILGCASIQCSGIRHEVDLNYVKTHPAIEIKYFAVLNKYQKLLYSDDIDDEHYYFSDDLLGFLISKCLEFSKNVIGADFIILYSVPNKVHFYERNHFKKYDEFMSRDNNQEISDCSPMFLFL